MTGIIDGAKSIWNTSKFAYSRSHNLYEGILYFVLGFLAHTSFWWGGYWNPRTWRVQSRDVQNICNKLTGKTSMENLNKSVVIVITALCNTVKSLNDLDCCISAIDVKYCIILVDDGSKVPIQMKRENVIVIRHPQNLGAAAGRNTGMSIALKIGAKSVAFTDADCIPHPKWASIMEEQQQKEPGIYAGITCASRISIIGKYHNSIGTLSPRVFVDDVIKSLYAPTANLCVSAEIIKKISFDERFPTSAFEDCDFCVRCPDKITVVSKAIVFHNYDDSVLGLMCQYYKYGQSEPLMYEKHPTYGAQLYKSLPINVSRYEKNI
tara:strand:+ start:6206 stop:7171 length:966 start_codon:yes stop_codon:yes gene_type:complete